MPSPVRFLSALFVVWLLLSSTLWVAAAEPAPARLPNFIMILIDDMGWGDFSCFGNKDAKTPQIDRLAAEGLRFEQFYVASPICSPSRVGLSTGQYPQRWRITSFLNNRAENNARGMAQWLDPKAPLLARMLHDAGYATGHFGKWHMGGQRDVDDAPPITAYGFDTSLTNFEGMGPKLLPLTLKPGDEKPERIWADAERLGQPVTWMQRSQITTGFADAALAFIDASARDSKPFYVNLWPDDVHSPFWPPVEQWRDGKRGLYHAVLESMDRQLGKLFDRIRSDPALRDNTLILVCSDNGPEVGAGSAGEFRGTKGMLYEGGVRSPLVVWGPGFTNTKKAGTANRASHFSTIDVAPTLLAIAGVSAPAGTTFDGVSMRETLLGRSEASRNRPLFFRRPPDRAAFAGDDKLPDLAVRDGRWKLLCTYDGSAPQLYDLDVDPAEKKNLAASQPAETARLAAAVVAWHRSLPADNGATYRPRATKKKS
ncbi:MAG: sulfatase [Opitutaceae bacterium]